MAAFKAVALDWRNTRRLIIDQTSAPIEIIGRSDASKAAESLTELWSVSYIFLYEDDASAQR